MIGCSDYKDSTRTSIHHLKYRGKLVTKNPQIKLNPFPATKMYKCNNESPRIIVKLWGIDEGLQKDENLSLGGVITRSRLKKLQEDINMKMNSLMEMEEEAALKIINYNQYFD